MGLEEFLRDFLANPLVFFLLAFGLSVLIAIVLPIPVELFLIIPFQAASATLMAVALLAVALGKAVGAWLVFLLGVRVEHVIHRWSARSAWIAKAVAWLEEFVRKTGALGLYVLLSVPLMSDTVVLYFYAVLNGEGKALDERLFIGSNFLAGVNRVALVFLLGLTWLPGLLNP